MIAGKVKSADSLAALLKASVITGILNVPPKPQVYLAKLVLMEDEGTFRRKLGEQLKIILRPGPPVDSFCFLDTMRWAVFLYLLP